MSEKPWWRDSRQLPPFPSTRLDRYFGGVSPTGLIFAGTLLMTAGVLAILLPDPSPLSLLAFGAGLLGTGILLRRKELRETGSSTSAPHRASGHETEPEP